MGQTKSIFSHSLLISITALVIGGCSPSQDGFSDSNSAIKNKLNDPNWKFLLSSYNVYGLKILSPDKPERMPAIGDAIAKRNLDAVLFQEAWTLQGRTDIRTHTAFPMWFYFDFPGTFGSGLFTMTNYFIEGTAFKPFTMDGRITRPWEGDRFTAKGISLVQITKNAVPVDLFDMHTLARYGDTATLPKDAYTPERLAQLFEAFDFILNKRRSPVFIVGADLNSDVTTEEFDFWKKLSGLEASDLGSAPDSCTYCAPNTFVTENQGQLDHITLSPFLQFNSIHRDYVDEKATLSDGSQISLSDHFGLTAEVGGNLQNRPYDINVTLNALSYLKWRLEDYKNWYSPLDFEDPAPVSDTNISGQIDYILSRVDFYLQTLTTTDAGFFKANPDAVTLRQNFSNYVGLF